MITLNYLFESWTLPESFKTKLDFLFDSFDKDKKYNILDAGSGRSSLQYLTTTFPNSFITAIVYPGDNRKIDSIKQDVSNNNYKLIQVDITKYQPNKKFDIILADKILGEASKWNTHQNVLKALIDIPSDYLIILDGLDDPQADMKSVLDEIKNKNLKILKRKQWKGNFSGSSGKTYATTIIGLTIKKDR